SKMRFVSAQFEARLGADRCLPNPRGANAMARRPPAPGRGLPAAEVPRPAGANAAFPSLPRALPPRLQKRFRFYTWDEAAGEVRWMCAWDTTEEDVDAFATALAEELAAT